MTIYAAKQAALTASLQMSVRKCKDFSSKKTLRRQNTFSTLNRLIQRMKGKWFLSSGIILKTVFAVLIYIEQ